MKGEPHTFCSVCNRVIGKSLVDAQGRCPDCTGKGAVSAESRLEAPRESVETPKRRWRAQDKDEDE